MKPMKSKMLKNSPIIVKTRTKIAPILILDLFSPFIITDPTIMIIPHARPNPPKRADTSAMSTPVIE